MSIEKSQVRKLPKDRYHLVIDNMGFVRFCISKYFNIYGQESDLYKELFSEGCLYLVMAAINFKEDLGNKFLTFASSYIINGMRRYMREKRNIIRMPRSLIDTRYHIQQLFDLGIDIDDISEELGIESSKVAAVISLNSILSLDDTVHGDKKDEKMLYADIIPDKRSFAMIEEIIEEDSVISTIEIVKEKLCNKLSRDVYEEYVYSILYDDPEGYKQTYLAKKYKVTQSYISRIIKKGNNIFQKYYQM